mgnify:CR=1 FL=1
MEVNPEVKKLREFNPEDEVSFVPMEAVGEYGGLDLGITRQIRDIGSGYTEFQDGDVVVAKITPCFENGKGALAEGLQNGVAFGTTEITVLRPLPTLERRFLFYLTISSAYRKTGEAEMYGAGGQKRVPPEFNKDFRTPLPPFPEQRAIVNFLDRQTAKIDTLVAKRRALIKKLKEKRTALISQTVTRGLPPDAARAAGLDPHPSLKPSGVEWLGEVPEGWEVLPLKRKFRVVNGGTPASAEEMYWDGDITWVTPDDLGKIETQKIAHSRRQITKDGLDNCSARLVPCSSIIMSTRAPIGHIAIADVEVCTNQGCRSLVPLNKSVLSDFIYYSLIGSKAVLQAKGKGTTFMELSSEDLGSHIVTVPSYLEQCAIANFLDRETVKIDRMVSLEEAVIERQQEYRSALITAAVTGKIDVRSFSHEHGTGSVRSAEA